jgi:hypothetical protein
MRWAILAGAFALNTALLAGGLRYWQMLTVDTALIGGWLIYMTVRNHPQALFAARVSGALFDLGLDSKRLHPRMSKMLRWEIHKIYAVTKGRLGPHMLAVRFFVYALCEEEDVPYGAVMRDGVLADSVSIIRGWGDEGKIKVETAETEIRKIKRFLIAKLPLLNLSEDERLATEIVILES